jgi:hypothetical protein
MALHAGLPQLQAQETDVATPDSFGGCSLKCAFQWTVTSVPKGSDHETRVIVLNDNNGKTAWRDVAGGIGAKITFHLPESIPAEMDGKVPFYGIDVVNGDQRSDATWKASARLKKARMYYNRKPVCDITFPDSKRWCTVSFDEIMVHSGDTMTLEVLETYPGKESKTLAIAEIVLQGAH